MAGVTVQTVFSGYLPKGGTHYLFFSKNYFAKNPNPIGLVWWFSVDVFITKYTSIFPGTRAIEVTRVEHRNELKPDLSQELLVHCVIQNTGDWEANYDLNMGFAPAVGGPPVSTTPTGIWVWPYFDPPGAAEVNTSGTQVAPQTVKPGPRHLVAFPVLQGVQETDDTTQTVAYISQYTDGGVTKTGRFGFISGKAVSEIIWAVDLSDSANNPLRVVLFFD